MSRQLLKSRRHFTAGALMAALIAFCNPVFGARALLNVEVPADKWKAMRLKNLPKNASLGARIESSGSIEVILVHGDELKQFPAAVNPEFQGSVERTLSFSVAVPRAGDYFLILDNRRNTQARKVRILIRAEKGRSTEGSTDSPGGTKKKNETDI